MSGGGRDRETLPGDEPEGKAERPASGSVARDTVSGLARDQASSGGGAGARETVRRRPAARRADRPPPPAEPLPITFSDLRREPDARPEGQEVSVDPKSLLRSGVSDAVRAKLTMPPPVPTEADQKAGAIVAEIRLCGPGDEGPFVRRLLALGPEALPVIARGFPGGRWFDRHAAHRRPPEGREVSPVAAALVAFGSEAAPWVAALLEADHPDLRYYAALVAGDLADGQLVAPLGRLVFDHDAGVREVALLGLRRMPKGPELEVLRTTLVRAATTPETYPAYRRRAIDALSELREVECIDALVPLVADLDTEVAATAADALRRLTGQAFGPAPARWRGWWARNAGRERVEWLADGLAQAKAGDRELAQSELEEATGASVGIDAAQSPEEGARARDAWLAWRLSVRGEPG